jgi:hypothetical protein
VDRGIGPQRPGGSGEATLEVDGPDQVRPAGLYDGNAEVSQATSDGAAVAHAERGGDLGGGQEFISPIRAQTTATTRDSLEVLAR